MAHLTFHSDLSMIEKNDVAPKQCLFVLLRRMKIVPPTLLHIENLDLNDIK